MTRDKKISYALAAAATAGLLLIVLLARGSLLFLSAVWLIIAAVAVCLLVKKRRAPSLTRQTVLLLTAVFVLLYFTVFYMSGLHFGFVKTTVPFNIKTFFNRIFPALAMIVASELIRRVLLCQEKRGIALLGFVTCLLGDLALAGGIGRIESLNALMDMVGLTLFPAMSTGVLCHFVSARHGVLPSIAYRALITLVPYLRASLAPL